MCLAGLYRVEEKGLALPIYRWEPERKLTRVMLNVSDPKPDCIRIQSGQWIRMQEGKNDPQNRKKFRNFMF
jgi:hypothetical protein